MATSRAVPELSRVWPQLTGRFVIGTFRGRSAIALACDLLGIGPGDEVLVPAYNCGTELDALLHAGVWPVGYQVSRNCEVDLADLMTRRTARTKAVYLIHYFGWGQPLVELRRWCDNEGLLLIEDCALSLFSSGASGAIGRTGDAAIFSLPKTLGLYHGGLLSMAGSHATDLPRLALAGFSTLANEVCRSVKARISQGLELIGLYGASLSARRRLRGKRQIVGVERGVPRLPEGYYFQSQIDANRGLHPLACAVAHSVAWREVVRRRRHNYTRLAGALDGILGAKPLYDHLPDGVCPLSLPLLVPNRDTCVEILCAKGIEVFPWWAGFHRNGIAWSEFPDACWLKHHLLTLPIHQDLDDRHVDYVAQTVAKVFRTTF